MDAEDSSLKARKEELNKIYLDTFSEETITCYNFDDLFDSICSRVLTKTHVILHNSDSSYIDSLTNFRKHRIYIGGDLLQRGLTFSKLTTSYFTRWPKSSGNMDTTLQRARWFGYRENYINCCKVFLTEEIAEEFYNLSETENDLWDQFYEIEEEKRTISDILIKIDSDSNLRPTRKNVANIISPRFRERWITQRQGIFDQNLIQDNNNYVRSLIEKNTLLDTRVGRRDDTISAQYFELGKNEVVEMIENLDSIFGNDSRFNKQVLLKKISMQDSTPIIIMNKEKPRERSFYTNNNIFALHQGRSNDNDTGKYLGDAEVIIDKNRINIQIHSIIPKINNGSDKKVEYQQFMIAVFDPQSQDKYFARED
ncbi:Z1 domain-containing protein [Erysipelothrix sp. Poltava]|nr:Z1 domain-containing protein [Erysipelothrix sp. Poltava]